MTSIEWLIEEWPRIETMVPPRIIEQAKEMHKQEIINSFKDAQVLKIMKDETRAEQYYNETFVSKRSDECCTPEGQIKRYVDCIGCDKKPKQETFKKD